MAIHQDDRSAYAQNHVTFHETITQIHTRDQQIFASVTDSPVIFIFTGRLS